MGHLLHGFSLADHPNIKQNSIRVLMKLGQYKDFAMKIICIVHKRP
jgi:hypothetical protein